MRTHTVAELIGVAEGTEVTLAGWVHRRRDHGPITFIDLRNRTEIVQVVVRWKEIDEALKETLKPESVVQIIGTVVTRRAGSENNDIATGKIEVITKEVKVLNESVVPPFVLDDIKGSVGEETRMKYRYVDLRRIQMQRNFKMRNEVAKLARQFLWDKDFIEVETPVLSKSTPEGARDYLVPSRVNAGKFYALPQSPQQYKQLLMTGGIEKYFQFAKCFRDEDQRGDRQPEFTQLDMELSFVTEEDVMQLNEALLINIVEKLFPEKIIQQKPFPRITYAEAMEKYGTDRPDLRLNKEDPNELAFCWVVDFPFFERAEKGGWTFTHNPFSSPKTSDTEKFTQTWIEFTNGNDSQIPKIISSQYDIVLNGFEIGGGSIRNHSDVSLFNVFQILGYSNERIMSDFGHMLSAFKLGTPPHGGIAWGFDRLMAILLNEPNIREVIAFPKNDKARDPMMDAPSEVSPEQLQELSIRVVKK